MSGTPIPKPANTDAMPDCQRCNNAKSITNEYKMAIL